MTWNPFENCNPSRRELLKALALASAGAVLPARAQAPSAATRGIPGRIDVHHHMTPAFYVKAMEKELAASGFTARPWTPSLSLEAMDKSGVATAMLSPVQRLVMDSMSDRSERARSLTRQSNEYGAQVVRDQPRRFGLLAALPLPDQDGSLREIEYAYDTLKADGISLGFRRDANLGDYAGRDKFCGVRQQVLEHLSQCDRIGKHPEMIGVASMVSGIDVIQTVVIT